MDRARIVVVGAVAVDVKAQSFGKLVRHADVPGTVRFTPGGVGRNMAKNFALLGANSMLISAIGDDEFEWLIRDDLVSAGVNIDRLMVVCGKRTATWVGVLDSFNDLDVGVFGGEILEAITPGALNRRFDMIERADFVVVDATLPRAVIDAIRRMVAREKLCLNPASVARAQTVADCVGDFGIVTANALEAEVLTGQTIRTIDDATLVAQMLIRWGVQRAIVTLGADGIVYADASVTRYTPALATQVVDTTGAGDALAATFLLCHREKKTLDESLALALHAAAITTACGESVSEEIGKIWTSH